MPYSICVKPNWLLLVLAAVLIALLMRLGVWQLHRADEKKKMIAAHAALAQEKPIWLKDGEALPQQYQQIKAKGYFLPALFLLDNQHHNHQFGFNVIVPLLLSNGFVVLIDRGFVRAPQTHSRVPDIKKPQQGLMTLQGQVYHPSPKQWVLGPIIEPKNNNTFIIERIDTKLLSQILQKKLYPFIIRQSESKDDGLVRDWPIVSMSPERHLGYAVQWFALALVLLMIVVALSIKKKND